MVRFGQVVVGPPGSGKTTYCNGMFQYLKAIGRDAAVINLDPANHGESLPYTPDLDIQDLVSLEVRAPGLREVNGAHCTVLHCTSHCWRYHLLVKLLSRFFFAKCRPSSELKCRQLTVRCSQRSPSFSTVWRRYYGRVGMKQRRASCVMRLNLGRCCGWYHSNIS